MKRDTVSKNARRSQTLPAVSLPLESSSAKRGRKPAKHSDPAYVQMSVYVPRELRNKVKGRLMEHEIEFSGLIETMLRDWLAKQLG